MIGFYIKKNFFDGWDNFLSLIVFNLISYALLTGLYFFIGLFAETPILFFTFLFIGIYLVTLLCFSISLATSEIANNKSVPLSSVFSNIPRVWKESLFLALFFLVVYYSATFVLSFYIYNVGGIFGFAIAGLVFWIMFMTLLAMQWFIPLTAQLGGGVFKNVKKSYLLLLDNGAFTLFLALYSIVLLLVTVFFAFLLPGFTGISLAQNNALKLRLYKYDWLEEYPEIAETKERKHIPWDELLAKDDEIIGPRSFKSLIFPWK